MAYAEGTEVPVEKSRAEIEKLIGKHKCTAFVTGVDHIERKAMVQFRANERIVRFVIELPNRNDKAYTHDARYTWNRRPPAAAQRAFEQAERQRWRALLLVIKAKLEAVESRIATFEEEFLAHIVMPNDRTVGQIVTPLVQSAYETGRMPMRLLPGAVAGDEEVVDAEQVSR